VKRFGSDYLMYKPNVPRWIPRLRPWDGEDPHQAREKPLKLIDKSELSDI
jgi:hypothetical protein